MGREQETNSIGKPRLMGYVVRIKMAMATKFIAAAKEFGVDETGKTFLASFKAIVRHKGKRGGN